jgi:hypothetical protein
MEKTKIVDKVGGVKAANRCHIIQAALLVGGLARYSGRRKWILREVKSGVT